MKYQLSGPCIRTSFQPTSSSLAVTGDFSKDSEVVDYTIEIPAADTQRVFTASDKSEEMEHCFADTKRRTLLYMSKTGENVEMLKC